MCLFEMNAYLSVCSAQALHSGQNEWASSRGVCVCKIICRTKEGEGLPLHVCVIEEPH